MKLIYVAGRFRAKTPWDVEQNVRKAEALGLEVAKAGGMPVIPHANTRFFDGQLTGQFWIEGTAALLRACHALILVPGNWEGSVGTAGELQIAKDRSLPIFLTGPALEPAGSGDLLVYASQYSGGYPWRTDLARFCALP